MVDVHDDFRLDIARRFRAADDKYVATLFRYYTIDQKVLDAFSEYSGAFLFDKSPFGHPYGLVLAQLKEQKLPKTEYIFYGGKPAPVIHLQSGEISLPETDYLVLASPCVKREQNRRDEMPARKTVEAAIGMLAAYFGRGFLLSYVGEHEIDPEPKDGKLQQSVVSPAIRMPHHDDYVYFTDARILSEPLEVLRKADENLRSRATYGLHLVGRAAQEREERFAVMLYWMGLEVLAEGDGKDVTACLAKAYRTDLTSIRNQLEVGPAIRFRTDLIHHGRMGLFSSRMERLLQCYFVDILRHKLGLECKRVSASAIATMNAELAKLQGLGLIPNQHA